MGGEEATQRRPTTPPSVAASCAHQTDLHMSRPEMGGAPVGTNEGYRKACEQYLPMFLRQRSDGGKALGQCLWDAKTWQELDACRGGRPSRIVSNEESEI